MRTQGVGAFQQEDVKIGRCQGLARDSRDVIKGAKEHQHRRPPGLFGINRQGCPEGIGRGSGSGFRPVCQLQQVLARAHGVLCWDAIRISAALWVSASN
ncbi:hypothetical protein GCM10007175_00330 [Pseudarthrobacter scleromae]|uniref:Uncharacterized protein n=1 Tax=Pseudarthrobacter scleromae TaxID=158897 RepID=A0ABQ2C7W0_9MICC|nr:hypothetical protein GCM10007175_00330 [Pseudarthrobacter scleromae]